MDKIALLKSIIQEFQLGELPHIFPRDKDVPSDLDYVVAVIGARRAGKTYLVLESIEKLVKSGIDIKKILYINFEDERLKDFTSYDLDFILQAYRGMYPNYDLKDTYFIFDEIQNIKGWEQFVRRIMERISKHLFVTGSNANLLSGELATALGGRTYTLELFPLSFKELLEFKGIPNDINSLYAPQIKAKVDEAFEEYLIYGGLPPIIQSKQSARRQLFIDHFDSVVYKDIIERNKLTNIKPVKYFLKQLANSNAKEFSVNKIYNVFKSAGFEISKDSIYEYFEYAQNVYFAIVLNKYESNIRLAEQTSKKVYIIDTGLANSLNTNNFDDKAKLLENAIFLNLYRKNKEIYFYKDKYSECDFILCVDGKPISAIQVSYSINDEDTKKREMNGLIRACKVLGLNEGTIIIFNGNKSEEQVDDIKINIIPAVHYMLSQ